MTAAPRRRVEVGEGELAGARVDAAQVHPAARVEAPLAHRPVGQLDAVGHVAHGLAGLVDEAHLDPVGDLGGGLGWRGARGGLGLRPWRDGPGRAAFALDKYEHAVAQRSAEHHRRLGGVGEFVPRVAPEPERQGAELQPGDAATP
ncbi:MAG: hypothetical protein IPF99_34900 [Deltaproteobacteria bacterium]|nr:hypothetical protein [Deltaproteobacteria bacterium]